MFVAFRAIISHTYHAATLYRSLTLFTGVMHAFFSHSTRSSVILIVALAAA